MGQLTISTVVDVIIQIATLRHPRRRLRSQSQSQSLSQNHNQSYSQHRHLRTEVLALENLAMLHHIADRSGVIVVRAVRIVMQNQLGQQMFALGRHLALTCRRPCLHPRARPEWAMSLVSQTLSVTNVASTVGVDRNTSSVFVKAHVVPFRLLQR